MQMALDMLNEIADDVYCDQKLEGVIAALEQALAVSTGEWVGLTDEEREHFRGLGFVGILAVEAKLKSKNHEGGTHEQR